MLPAKKTDTRVLLKKIENLRMRTHAKLQTECLWACMHKVITLYHSVGLNENVLLLSIVKRHPQKYANVVTRLGGFHIAENFLKSIGFFMKDGGIEELLTESGVCKRGTANKVIAGRDY